VREGGNGTWPVGGGGENEKKKETGEQNPNVWSGTQNGPGRRLVRKGGYGKTLDCEGNRKERFRGNKCRRPWIGYWICRIIATKQKKQ